MVVKYGEGIVEWTKEGRAKRVPKGKEDNAINRCLHPGSNVGRLYLSTKEGGIGLIKVEVCATSECESLHEYFQNSQK